MKTALDWQKAMTSVTGGGSEYCDPESCRVYFQDIRKQLIIAKLLLAKHKLMSEFREKMEI